MSKFFIGFLILFAIVGTAYRLNVQKELPVSIVTYTNEELGFAVRYPEDVHIHVGEPIIIPIEAQPIDIMVANTVMDGSGLNPKPADFKKEITPYTTAYYVQSGRFEATISYDAYVFKDNFLIPIHYYWMNPRWTDPQYDPTKDKEFSDFIKILRSVEFINQESGIYEGNV